MNIPLLTTRVAALQRKGLTFKDIAFALGYGEKGLKIMYGKKKKEFSDKKRHLSHTGPPNSARRQCNLCDKLYKERGWL